MNGAILQKLGVRTVWRTFALLHDACTNTSGVYLSLSSPFSSQITGEEISRMDRLCWPTV